MKTAKLFNSSLLLLVLSLIAAYSWTALGFKNKDMPFIVILFIICFALNVTGVFLGFYEERKSKKEFLYGIIGNSIFVALYLTFFIYVLTTM